MPAKKYLVALTPEQRQQAESVARSYKHSALERKRAQILLRADTNRPEGQASDQAIAQEVQVSDVTVQNVRQRFAKGGLKAALYRKEQRHRKARLLDGAAEACLVATVCSAPPQGKGRWSLHLLKDRLIQAGYTDTLSHETVRQTLKKMHLNPG
jgi:transposase